MAGGRPPTDPALLEEALALCEDGASPQEAAEQLAARGKVISWRTIYRAQEAQRKAAAAPRPPRKAPTLAKGTKPNAPARGAARPNAASQRPPRDTDGDDRAKPPPGLKGVDADLWILDREIAATSRQLDAARRRADEGGSTHGLAGLGKLLADLVKRRAALRPPPPPSADEEERRWRGEADAVLQILRARLPQILAKRAAREKPPEAA